jgi:1-pyrroline-5-carboxylate dehydrogenase
MRKTMDVKNLPEYKNEALTDFSVEANADLMRQALVKRRKTLGDHHEIFINGVEEKTNKSINSVNPANIKEVVGTVGSASPEQAARAIEIAADAFKTWKNTSVDERAGLLIKISSLMRERKFDISALMVLEVGKSWVEADADTAEAIDFLEYYAREALRLDDPAPLVPVTGENNRLVYIPLGVGICIPPWNFPFAILAGMACAALVCGNTVVLKPSSDSPVIAAEFVKLLREVGVPDGVFNFCPGSGSEIGDILVDHPKTRFISFTGSKAVGLRIVERAAQTQPEQIWIKRVVAEMGGKDTILVDDDVDINEVVDGVLAAAFGYSGQKCSACSRVVVHERIYDDFLEKLVSRTKELITVGDLEDNKNYMGAVSSQQAYQSILNYIEVGKKEGRLMTGGSAIGDKGWFIEPTIIADIKPDATISLEEIFGPVLAVIKCKDFPEGLDICNNSDYGLTGAAYSNKAAHLELAEREFHVGNLYLNRKCTGALVGAHPFGGFNMSGTDSKAGGYDYLLLFTQGKMVSSKIQANEA